MAREADLDRGLPVVGGRLALVQLGWRRERTRCLTQHWHRNGGRKTTRHLAQLFPMPQTYLRPQERHLPKFPRNRRRRHRRKIKKIRNLRGPTRCVRAKESLERHTSLR